MIAILKDEGATEKVKMRLLSDLDSFESRSESGMERCEKIIAGTLEK